MSGPPVTPQHQTSNSSSDVIPTLPPSFPRTSWITKNGVARLWSADDPMSLELIPYARPPHPSIPPPPFSLSPTRAAYPQRRSSDVPNPPVQRLLFPDPNSGLPPAPSSTSPLSPLHRLPTPMKHGEANTPPPTPSQRTLKDTQHGPRHSLAETIPLFLPSSPKEKFKPLPATTSSPSTKQLAIQSGQNGWTRDDAVVISDDSDDDERLTAVNSEQIRELSERMRRTSMEENGKTKRSRQDQEDDEDDEDVAYKWTVRPVKRPRANSSLLPSKQRREQPRNRPDSGIEEGSDVEMNPPGKLPRGGILSPKIKARLFGKGWKEIATDAGARREDFDTCRLWMARCRQMLPEMIRKGLF